MPQQFGTNNLGGYLSVPFLTDRIRTVSQPLMRFRQFAEPKDAVGRKRGDRFMFDKIKNVATQGGPLVETSPIPQTTFTINQGSVVMTEYGNSVPWTGKLEELSQIGLPPLVEEALRNDLAKTLDAAAAAEFMGTEFVAVLTDATTTTITTNGTPAGSAGSNLNGTHVRRIVDWMKMRNIPTWDGQSYICVTSIVARSGLFADAAAGGWVDVSKYTPEYARNVVSGEVGTYYGVRFIEETNSLSNSIGTGGAYGQAVFFGADSVYEAVAVPEEIRVKVSTDYGRDLGLAWYAILGFKRVWDYANDGEQHIVFVTSA